MGDENVRLPTAKGSQTVLNAGTAAVHLKLEIERWPVDRLIPDHANPRTHTAEQIAQIAASIREFGFVCPILVDTDGTIIAGEGRLRAAKSLEMGEVPVIAVGHLSEAQRRALAIADNQLALNAGVGRGNASPATGCASR